MEELRAGGGRAAQAEACGGYGRADIREGRGDEKQARRRTEQCAAQWEGRFPRGWPLLYPIWADLAGGFQCVSSLAHRALYFYLRLSRPRPDMFPPSSPLPHTARTPSVAPQHWPRAWPAGARRQRSPGARRRCHTRPFKYPEAPAYNVYKRSACSTFWTSPRHATGGRHACEGCGVAPALRSILRPLSSFPTRPR